MKTGSLLSPRTGAMSTVMISALTASTLLPNLKQDVNVPKPQSLLEHSLGTCAFFEIILIDRVLWLVTLVLVGRQVYLDHVGTVSNGQPVVVSNGAKEEGIQMSSSVDGAPQSQLNL
jgi:hypothetical protein